MSSINNSSTLHQINEMWAGYHTRKLNTEMSDLRRQATDRVETLVNNIPMSGGYGGIRISDDGTFETTGHIIRGTTEIYDPELHAIVDKTLRGDDKLAEILGKIRDYEYKEHKVPPQSDTPSPLQQLDKNGNPVASNSDEVLARMKANAHIFQRSFIDHEMIAFPTGLNAHDLPISELITTTVSSGGRQITSPDGDMATISQEALSASTGVTSGSSGLFANMINRPQGESAELIAQIRNRMTRLIGEIQMPGVAGAKVNADGSYEVHAEAYNDGQAAALKAEAERVFSEDKTLNGLWGQLKTLSDANAAAPKDDEADVPLSTLNVVDANGCIVEISEESRAMAARLREANPGRFQASYDHPGNRVVLMPTAMPYQNAAQRAETERYASEISPILEGQRDAFRTFADQLVEELREAGSFQNDFLLDMNDDREIIVAEVSSPTESGSPTATADQEKKAVMAILERLNRAMKSEPSDDDTPIVKTLRSYFNYADQYKDAVVKYNSANTFSPESNKANFPYHLATSFFLK